MTPDFMARRPSLPQYKIILVKFKNGKENSTMVCIVKNGPKKSMISEVRNRYKTNGTPLTIVETIDHNIFSCRKKKKEAQKTLHDFQHHLGRKILTEPMDIGYLDRLLTLMVHASGMFSKHLQ